MAFDTQITDLVGGTIDQVACDQWAADACKEIINQLPAKLKTKCSAATTLNNSTTVMDMDAVGEVLFVTRDSADSGGYQITCREIPAQYGGHATDSTDLNYYGTATDPVYWIDGNTSDAATLYVKPTPTANQTSIVHHISYPSVDVDAVSVIANFPDEAEYLVVLYVSTKQLLQYMSSSSISTFTLSVVPPANPSNPTISYSNAFLGHPVSAAQDSIAGAVDGIIAGPSDAAGITDTGAPSTAAGVSDTEAPQDATGSTASAYTSPSVTGDAGLTGMEAGTIADATDQIEFDTWWDVLGDLIETNEDTELASAQLAKINSYISAFQAEVSDASSLMQSTISDAQFATQASIANASNDVSTNNASIASLTQASIANAANDVSTNNASIASRTQASIANAANDVSAATAKMQQSTSAATAKMQQSTTAAIQKMQLS